VSADGGLRRLTDLGLSLDEVLLAEEWICSDMATLLRQLG
jgi:hypothetical protein